MKTLFTTVRYSDHQFYECFRGEIIILVKLSRKSCYKLWWLQQNKTYTLLFKIQLLCTSWISDLQELHFLSFLLLVQILFKVVLKCKLLTYFTILYFYYHFAFGLLAFSLPNFRVPFKYMLLSMGLTVDTKNSCWLEINFLQFLSDKSGYPSLPEKCLTQV